MTKTGIGLLLLLSAVCPLRAEIKRIDLVHLSHTDFGFTDHPIVCREMQRRYLDVALDAISATAARPPRARFYWTAETTDPVNDWWEAASPARRTEFLRAVESGQLEVAALPLNQAPFLDREQWRRMLAWLPKDLWDRLRPKVAIQDDVNGLPRAGAVGLLDQGVRYLLTGINSDSGGPPVRPPTAFWWRMPDGRRMFVWVGLGYGSGHSFFGKGWRQGPLPLAADTRYRPPREGDMLRSDENSVREAHQVCLNGIRRLEQDGYQYETLALSTTNQWRIDNDPPFPPLADFVATWNRLGLKPELHLTTASAAIEGLEREVGNRIPEYQGEWTDWWANGAASSPREVSASRFAKRYLKAVQSPVWGAMDGNTRQVIDELYKNLCLFDEHTWGSSYSIALPDSLDTLGQFSEKVILAYRPMARAEWLLSQRVRTKLGSEPEGLYLANTSKASFTGWIDLPVTSFRGAWQSVEDPRTGARMKLYFENGMRPYTKPDGPEQISRENLAATFPDNVPGQMARFWVEKLASESIRHFRLSTGSAPDEISRARPPEMRANQAGWPVSIRWAGMRKPLFLAGLADFFSVGIQGFAPRWALREIMATRNETERENMRKERIVEISSTADEPAIFRETPHTLVYTQPVRHPRLRWATRQLEIWKSEPRARLTFRLYRISSDAPESYYVVFPLPVEGALPRLSNGGLPFIPFRDQLPGTCRDYFAIDGWAHYSTPDGNWLWVSRDAPLVGFGSHAALSRRRDPPQDTHRLLAMLFNNFWYTNFVGNSNGAMEFQFDLMWAADLASPADVAESLVTPPVVSINPALREHPALTERLFRP